MNDGFFIAELDGRRFDICVIGGLPRFIRAQDGLRVEVDVFDRLGDGMGKLSEAATFTAGGYCGGTPAASKAWGEIADHEAYIRELRGE